MKTTIECWNEAVRFPPLKQISNSEEYEAMVTFCELTYGALEGLAQGRVKASAVAERVLRARMATAEAYIDMWDEGTTAEQWEEVRAV